jgi:hypothetical protein
MHTGLVWFIEILLWMLRSSKQTFENLGLLSGRAERDKVCYEKIEKVRSLPAYKSTDIWKINDLDLKKCGTESDGPSVAESDVCSTWAEAIPGDISDDQIIELQQRTNIKLAEFLTVEDSLQLAAGSFNYLLKKYDTFGKEIKSSK